MLERLRFVLPALLLATLAAPAQARAPGEINVFAWTVTPPGGGASSTLVGTMHVSLTSGKKLPAAVTRAMAGAQHFVMEADLDQVSPDLVTRYCLLPPGAKGLKARVGAKEFAKLVALGGKKGLQPAQLDRFAPWYAALALLDLHGDPGKLMDAELRHEAEQRKVPVAFLETPEEQFKILAGVAEKEEIGQLKEELDDPKQAQRELDDLENSYLEGKLDKVEKLTFEPARMKQYPNFYRRLFYERNARWAPRLASMCKSGNTFVAVGLGHMLGDKGVLALLSKQGFKAKKLPL